MKSLTLRTSVALACALSLAACGGGSANLQLGGTVYNVNKDGLVLQNKGGPPLAIAAGAGGFVFPQLLKSDEDFDIQIVSPPSNAVCKVIGGTGRTGAFSITSVIVNCVINTYELGGTITGLGNATGLVLVNGADRQEIAPGATTFTMTRLTADKVYVSGKVADSAPYGITVLTQPAGLTCSVQNGVGMMGAGNVSNVQVNCV